MFKELDGPTALRADLVLALSFSHGSAELETDDGIERCCAGLVAVWNGKKGFVAVIVRQLDQPRLRRWVYEASLKDAGSVLTAFEAGLAFTTSLGLEMDEIPYTEIGGDERSSRIDLWNDMRKLSRQPNLGSRHDAETAAPESAITADDHGGAVLGRLTLVRKGGGYAGPLARLLSYF
ncbi:MAG: hypothetical protein JRG76_15635 [Deltaproteobacteria bacterium]|nr:hypothetical protein [Deltaproteobacteria bacterium]